MDTLLKTAKKKDQEDPLARYRDHFQNNENVIYLDGNSLGKLPLKTIDILKKTIKEEWGTRLIRSWNEQWIDLSRKTAAKIAPIVGAQADEIFVGDSTSINLYKLAFAVLKYQSAKKEIVSDEINFPTDLYVLQGLIEQIFSDHTLKLAKSKNGITVENDALEELLNQNTALLTLSHVAFKSSFRYSMHEVNELAHREGALVLWDLSHSVGAYPIQLNESNADLAVGCTYKYLNGGPGAPAFLYVKKELQEKLINPISSWFSHEKPFDFSLDYKADNSIQKFATGTPNILSLKAIEPGLDLLLEAGIQAVWGKSQLQSAFLMECVNELLVPMGFQIASPENSEHRGSHLSITHPEAYRINRAMIEPQNHPTVIIPDFRPPNNIRIGITPLYTSYEELFLAVKRIKDIVDNREYLSFGDQKLAVT